MIKIFYEEEIINRLASIITFGLNNNYSYKSIEERIVSSYFINALENNNYDIDLTNEKIVEDVYHIKLDKEVDISFRGLFFAESYVKLFFYYNKSFEYLFLYWPLSSFVNKYNIYHEMDFSNLREDFELIVKQETLIKKLCVNKGFKYVDVAKLTGININLLIRYSRSDKYLYASSYDNIYKLATLFNVKENVFVSKLNVYLDESIYLCDKTYDDYRNYLGLYFANFFDKRINENNFIFFNKNDCFISTDGSLKLKVIAMNIKDVNVAMINSIADKNTYIVLFVTGFYFANDFHFLKTSIAYEILIVAQDNVFIIKNDTKKEVTDSINKSLIIRAKSIKEVKRLA